MALILKQTLDYRSLNAVSFITGMMQYILQNRKNLAQVHSFLQTNISDIDEVVLEMLPTAFESCRLGKTPEAEVLIIECFVVFAKTIQEFLLGDRALNLELSITVYHQVLKVITCEAQPEEWATIHNNLGNALSNRIRGNQAENKEQAIEHLNLALKVRKPDVFPQQWARTQMNLGNAYNRHIKGNRAENLEQAIFHRQQALQIYTNETLSEQWATIQMNLAVDYLERIKDDRVQNIERSIAASEQALQFYTHDAFPADWMLLKGNLVSAYRQRIHGNKTDNLKQAITIAEEALQVVPREIAPEYWAMLQTNLGNLYLELIDIRMNLGDAYLRIPVGDQANNLEKAIAAFKDAEQVYTRDAFPTDWAMLQMNLGNGYAFQQGNRADNLEKAILAYKQSLQIFTRKNFPTNWATVKFNLGGAYRKRIYGKQADNLKKAITAYKQSLQVFTSSDFPSKCRKIAHNLGDIYFEQQDWASAAQAYTTALTASETLYKFSILLSSQLAELRESSYIARRTAYVLARIGNLEKAVEVLEQYRARGTSEALERDRADLSTLQQYHPYLFTQYQDITTQLRALEAQERDWLSSTSRHNLTPEDLYTEATRLRRALVETIEQVRNIEGFADFLKQPEFKDVLAAIQPGIPLIYLLSTVAGSLALIITSDKVSALWLNGFTEVNLLQLSSSKSDAVLNQGSGELWQSLMEPLIRYLKDYQIHQATLIPTGLLSFVPLHAAWTEDPSTPTGRRYALDEINFTYAPNAKLLLMARKIAIGTSADSILAIDNPRNDLPNSEREVQAAIESFHHHTVLQQSEATIGAVRSHLLEASIVHFSCHGTANITSPLNSGLLMSDGLLTLRDILALNLSDRGGIRLAILSACETGLPGIENADEVVSLPTGLLQAGVAGIISSLWSVSDQSTMLLLTKFYELWRKQNIPPDQALRQAQIWLRDSIFDHPFHWAAFHYTGI